jgi:hypothetical protein
MRQQAVIRLDDQTDGSRLLQERNKSEKPEFEKLKLKLHYCRGCVKNRQFSEKSAF